MRSTANIFAAMSAARDCENEEVSEILVRDGLRIERIVSMGHQSPPDFWYEQPWDEWVLLLSGAARLRFEKEADARPLAAGDYVFIPAKTRHRVDWTSLDHPTVWLAVHYRAQADVL